MRVMWLAMTLLVGATGCLGHSSGSGSGWSRRLRRCPPGYTPVCQSGSLYGTRCTCEPPRRFHEQ